jgi:hypothetical protein
MLPLIEGGRFKFAISRQNQLCAHIVLDTADIVRDGDISPNDEGYGDLDYTTNALREISSKISRP